MTTLRIHLPQPLRSMSGRPTEPPPGQKVAPPVVGVAGPRRPKKLIVGVAVAVLVAVVAGLLIAQSLTGDDEEQIAAGSGPT